MTVLLADPTGLAVDWDWQRHLTVWATAGRHYEPIFESKLLEYELPERPASQRQARAAAGRWWRTEGRTRALAALEAERQPSQ